MDGNMSNGGNFTFGGTYDLQRSMQIHHQVTFHHSRQLNVAQPSIPEGFPLINESFPTCDRIIGIGDLNKGDRSRNSTSDEDDRSLDGVDCRKGSPWHRVKWTDKMVRLLITAVSYIGEDAAPECGGRRKFTVLQRKGKWKSVSMVLAERGFRVSPQQCEDKFNDLNKRYKKLNDMLGRGTSCSIVEDPTKLDTIGFLNDKQKDGVRKILNSKQLFYEEMCSYHNCSRLHLPHDPELQRSMQQALKNRDGHENNDTRKYHDDLEELDDLDMEHDINLASSGNSKAKSQQKPRMIESHFVELEEQKLQIQIVLLELEKEKFKWEGFCRKKDGELEKMRLENEKMKIENERLALEIKHKKMAGEYD